MAPEHKDEAPRPLADRLDESEEDTEALRSLATRKSSWIWTSLKWIGLFAILVVTSIISWHFGARYSSRPSQLDSQCAAHTAQWSPLLRDVDVTYSWQNFNGSFMRENIYRQKGSPEVDAAWDALGVNYRAGVISYEDGIKSGLEDSFVQQNPKYGGGFFVNVEGMHHLHCLNLVRKSLYFNYDYYQELGEHAFQNKEHILRLHVTHCLDQVRQVLMCNIDTGVLGQVWAGEQAVAFPDFNTQHKCKNYKAIQDWAGKLQAPPAEKVPPDFLKPPASDDVLPGTP